MWSKDMKDFRNSYRAFKWNFSPAQLRDRLSGYAYIENPDTGKKRAMTVQALHLLRMSANRNLYGELDCAFTALQKAGHPDNGHIHSYVSAIQKNLKRDYDGANCFASKNYADETSKEIDEAYRKSGFTYPTSLKPEQVCPSIRDKITVITDIAN